MSLSKSEIRQILQAVSQLPPSTPPVRVEEFISKTLGLNVAQRGQYFPSPDPHGLLDIAVAHLTNERERILRDDCLIPEFIVHKDKQNVNYVSGFDAYLASQKADTVLRGRLAHHREIRTALRRIQNGHDLEALAAAIMNVLCDYGEATRGSGDQGIDAVAWKKLILIEPSISLGVFAENEVMPGEKVFLFASSKAFTDGGTGSPKIINPAHIRELVGGWVIQRSSIGKWQSVGIRMLSPVQMILVTTYRLSIDSKSECKELGVQVWSIPELIYLVCSAAPDSVFDAANGFLFSLTQFNAWWKQRQKTKLMAANKP